MDILISLGYIQSQAQQFFSIKLNAKLVEFYLIVCVDDIIIIGIGDHLNEIS